MAEDPNFLAAHHRHPLAEQDSLATLQGQVVPHNPSTLEVNRLDWMGAIQTRPG